MTLTLEALTRQITQELGLSPDTQKVIKGEGMSSGDSHNTYAHIHRHTQPLTFVILFF